MRLSAEATLTEYEAQPFVKEFAGRDMRTVILRRTAGWYQQEGCLWSRDLTTAIRMVARPGEMAVLLLVVDQINIGPVVVAAVKSEAGNAGRVRPHLP